MTTDAAPSTDEAFKANFSRNLARLREAAGLNRAQFARLIGVDKMRITRFESGDCAPGGALLLKIAAALSTTAEALAAEPDVGNQPAEHLPENVSAETSPAAEPPKGKRRA